MPARSTPLIYPELAAAMARADLTQGQLADRVGCHRHTINETIRGRYRPSAELRQRIADALGGNPEHLFTISDDVRRLVDQAVEQGFRDTVDDPVVLARIATLAKRAAS